MVNPIVLNIAVYGIPAGYELVFILVVILILFGGKKIPELMRGVGRGMGELQKGLHESRKTINEAMREELEKPDEDLSDKPGSVKSAPKE